jgi:hypothetical protein
MRQTEFTIWLMERSIDLMDAGVEYVVSVSHVSISDRP